MYQLPLGIQIPGKDEADYKRKDFEHMQQKRAQAKIIEGYKINKYDNKEFRYVLEINIDADRIWNLFTTLANTLIRGEMAYGIIGMKGKEPFLSRFTLPNHIINLFEKYEFELINDGFLQFGIAMDDGITYNEVFVASYKYIQVWCVNRDAVVSVLNQFNLNEHADLNFIDEFDVASIALTAFKIPGIPHFTEVLQDLENSFAQLG